MIWTENSDGMMESIISCRQCKTTHIIIITVDKYNSWLSGELIQYAMPDISADNRELIMSGICGKCLLKSSLPLRWWNR